MPHITLMRDRNAVSDEWIREHRKVIRGVAAKALGYRSHEISLLVRDHNPLDENVLPFELVVDAGTRIKDLKAQTLRFVDFLKKSGCLPKNLRTYQMGIWVRAHMTNHFVLV